MNKKDRVTLTAAERQELDGLLARGKADVRRLKHAHILLKADQADAGPAWPDTRIAEALDVGITTVERVRQRFVEEGLASALSHYRGGKRISSRKLDGTQEAARPRHRTRLLHAAGRAWALDVAPARPAHGRTHRCGHALLRDGAPDPQKRTRSNRI